MVDALPCQLCWFAEWRNHGMLLVTYCHKQRDVICDRQWINPEMCWKYCECVTCPWRLMEENNPWGE